MELVIVPMENHIFHNLNESYSYRRLGTELIMEHWTSLDSFSWVHDKVHHKMYIIYLCYIFVNNNYMFNNLIIM